MNFRTDTDTSVKKVSSNHSPTGSMGQKYLVSGKKVAMRLWREGQTLNKPERTREYETVGYVIEGSAILHLEGQRILLNTGDSWLVPAGATHRYEIRDSFCAVEATSPPAQVHARDEA